MGRLIYLTNVSLDGFIEGEDGSHDGFGTDDAVFAHATALVRSVGAFVYGRRLYEAMAVWETDPALAARSPETAAFAAAWQDADKVVVSRTLTAGPAEVATARTTLAPSFDPDAVRALVAGTDRDVMVGGADLASQALVAGLVDEVRLLVWPVALGGGRPGLPVGTRVHLELVEHRRFHNGVLDLRYRPLPG